MLTYLVEETLAGRGERINQTSIAIDALGRGVEFDPTIDAVVRLEARRLRSRLVEYYYREGKEDTIRFELPKGHYIPRISFEPEPDKTGVSVAVDSLKSAAYALRRAPRSAI